MKDNYQYRMNYSSYEWCRNRKAALDNERKMYKAIAIMLTIGAYLLSAWAR